MKNMLTIRKAFDAMTDFLTTYYEKTKSGQINSLLSDMDMRTWGDGNQTADPAIWEDWIECVNTDCELTSLKAFQAVQKFVAMRYVCEPDKDVIRLVSGMHIGKDGSIANPVFWEHWMKSINKVLERTKID